LDGGELSGLVFTPLPLFVPPRGDLMAHYLLFTCFSFILMQHTEFSK